MNDASDQNELERRDHGRGSPAGSHSVFAEDSAKGCTHCVHK